MMLEDFDWSEGYLAGEKTWNVHRCGWFELELDQTPGRGRSEESMPSRQQVGSDFEVFGVEASTVG